MLQCICTAWRFKNQWERVSVTVFAVVACLPDSKFVKLHVDNHALELKFLGLVHVWYNCNAPQEAKCKSQRDPALSSL